MERRKLQKRRLRCSTEPPPNLVCTQITRQSSVLQSTSPDLLNVSWTWDGRLRRNQTLKRRPTVATSFKRRPTFRKVKKNAVSIISTRQSSSSQCSSEFSSEYYDALIDNNTDTILDDVWSCDLENFCDAVDDIRQVYLYEEQRMDAITQKYSRLCSTAAADQLQDRESSHVTDITKLDQSKTHVNASYIDCQSSADGETKRKARNTSCVAMVTKTIKWTLRKSDLLFPRYYKRNVDKSSESNIEIESAYNTLPSVKSSDKKNNNVQCKMKILWRRLRESKDSVKKFQFIRNNTDAKDIEKEVSNVLQYESTDTLQSRKCSTYQSFNHTRHKKGSLFNFDTINYRNNVKSNGWRTKYKKSVCSSTTWEYRDQARGKLSSNQLVCPDNRPLSDRCTKAASVTGFGSLKSRTTNSAMLDHSPPARTNTTALSGPQQRTRDTVELFDIRALTDPVDCPDNKNGYIREPTCRVTLTETDSNIDDSLVRSIEESIVKNNGNLDRPTRIRSAPPSPFLQRFLTTISDSKTVSIGCSIREIKII